MVIIELSNLDASSFPYTLDAHILFPAERVLTTCDTGIPQRTTYSSLHLIQGSVSPRLVSGFPNFMFCFCKCCQSRHYMATDPVTYQSQTEMYRRWADLNSVCCLLSLNQRHDILRYSRSLSSTGARGFMSPRVSDIPDCEQIPVFRVLELQRRQHLDVAVVGVEN